MTDIECRSIATFDQLVQTFADRAGDHHIRAEGVHRVYTNGLFSVSSALEKLRIGLERRNHRRGNGTRLVRALIERDYGKAIAERVLGSVPAEDGIKASSLRDIQTRIHAEVGKLKAAMQARTDRLAALEKTRQALDAMRERIGSAAADSRVLREYFPSGQAGPWRPPHLPGPTGRLSAEQAATVEKFNATENKFLDDKFDLFKTFVQNHFDLLASERFRQAFEDIGPEDAAGRRQYLVLALCVCLRDRIEGKDGPDASDLARVSALFPGLELAAPPAREELFSRLLDAMPVAKGRTWNDAEALYKAMYGQGLRRRVPSTGDGHPLADRGHTSPGASGNKVILYVHPGCQDGWIDDALRRLAAATAEEAHALQTQMKNLRSEIAEMRQTLDRVSNTLAAAGRPGP